MQMTRKEMLAMVVAMDKYGGSFVCSLADCFLHADENNLQRLYAAFPEYVEQYSHMAKLDAERDARLDTND